MYKNSFGKQPNFSSKFAGDAFFLPTAHNVVLFKAQGILPYHKLFGHTQALPTMYPRRYRYVFIQTRSYGYAFLLHLSLDTSLYVCVGSISTRNINMPSITNPTPTKGEIKELLYTTLYLEGYTYHCVWKICIYTTSLPGYLSVCVQLLILKDFCLHHQHT